MSSDKRDGNGKRDSVGRPETAAAPAADPHREREQARYDSPIASREHIASVLRSSAGPMDFEALADELGLTGDADQMEALRRRVGAMQRDGQLIQNRRRGLVPVDADALIAGRISAHPDGFGFLISDDDDKDVYLNARQMRQVLHGDRVVACITGIDQRGRREGRIVDVVERANHSLVGRLVVEQGTVIVLPDNKRIHQDLLVAPGELHGGNDGDMVVAEIIEQPTRRHQPVGRIVEVLGAHLRPGMEIDVALHSHGIPVDWPDAVTEQAAGFSPTVEVGSDKGRKDIRQLPLITIDGADARDFDDAVWCEKRGDGWQLMVAIADVAHYVKAGSPLDVEAVARGTSVYFPGRVVPMLPEVLSNGLCSLNPQVDRLCMLCEMTLDAQGNTRKVAFHNAVMRSHARLTYSQVHEMLTDSASALRAEHASLVPMIEELHRLYQALAARRRKRGAIEFDSTETRILFDDNKKIREIIPVVRNDAHKLIEECMILANIAAAAYLEAHEISTLYRVHAGPKPDRLEDLKAFLALRGLTLSGGDQPSALDYAALAQDIEDRPDRSVIQTVMLRSMQQAVYQPKNEGHFGLALEQYAHFTSPIRRYPDLMVHRAIKHLVGGDKASAFPWSAADVQSLGESCSMTERRAEEASRDVVSWLKCEYMQDHVGGEFPGVISAVTSFGLFVELTGIHIEGLIHITNLERDFYRFEQAAHALVGERTGRQYHLGESMVVRVEAVNLEERKIDFSEVSHQASGSKAARAAAGRKRRDGKGAESGQGGQWKKGGKGSQGSKRGRGGRGGKGGKQPSQQEPVVALASAAAGVSGKAADKGKAATTGKQGGGPGEQRAAQNPEHRRQQKRKRKQQRRDEKRALQNAARKPASRKAKLDAKRARQSAAAKGGQAISADDSATNRKVAAKKTATRTSTAKKTAAKRSAANKSTAKKTTAGKTVVKQSTARKTAAKKSAMKKLAARKSTTKKSTAKKFTAKKTATKKTAAKKTAAKETATKKTATKKTAAKKTAAKETAAKKTAARKPVAKKSTAKQSTAKRRGAGTVVTKKTSAGKQQSATRKRTATQRKRAKDQS